MERETIIHGTNFTEPNEREIVATHWFDAPQRLEEYLRGLTQT